MTGRKQAALAGRIAFASLLVIAGSQTAARGDEAALARAIFDTTGFSGGLIVHVGSNGGQLTAALRANNRTTVHGLDDRDDDVAAARRHIREAGTYGPVSVEPWEGPTLPYADRMVNLLVVAEEADLAREEILRVLCPGGQAVFLPNATSSTKDRDEKPALTKLIKPWPETLDEWTHFLHDPTNNAVAQDSVVGPPGRLQWTAGPAWGKEHDVTPSVFAPVSSQGRLFYILNEGPTCAIDQRLPDRYSVVARDAFNGMPLWKRPMTDWYSSRVIWGHIPVHSQRRLVAVGDRVYVTLGLQSPVTALDAATGAILREYAGTEQTSEIVASGGCLALVTRKAHALDGLLAGRDGNRFRKGFAGPKEGGDGLLVVRQDTGECLWRSKHRCMPLTLAVAGNRLLFAEERAVVCLDLETGKSLWTAPCPEVRTVVVQGDTLFVANAHPKKVTLTALDLPTGRKLWTRDAGSLPNFLFFFAPLDVFVARGLVWGMAEGLEWNERPGSGHLLGLEPRTGEVGRRVPLSGAFTTGHHVRCYKGKATTEYLLFNKRGIEFVGLDAKSPPVPNNYQWVRGTCRYGILPCNGLIYAPSHACACYPGAKLNGFLALAPHAPADATGSAPASAPTAPRLVKGPAYGPARKLATADAPPKQVDEWPTYRGDGRRSGHTPGSVPANLAVAWEVELDTKLSSVVVANGKVLVAAIDDYTLHARGAADGSPLWSYTAGARIDSPPTLFQGTAIFGCRDGWVYCLRLDDGRLVWRFHAAPRFRRVGAAGRLESPWPVHGSVLVKNRVAYFAAGRSSFLDGGIHMYGVDARTGQLRFQTRLGRSTLKAQTGRVTSGRMAGAVADILASNETGLTMRHVRFDCQLSPPPPEQFTWGSKADSHLIAGSGFLDDTLFNRSVWRYGIRIDRSQMLSIDGTDVYGLRVYDGISWNCSVHQLGDGHLLFRQDVSRPVPRPGPKKNRRMNRIPTERYAWNTRVPLRVGAMLLAGSPAERLFAAGVPDRVAPGDDPLAFIEGRRGAQLVVLDANSGEQTNQIPLDAPPVWDGMAAAYGKLFLATSQGTLVCLAPD